METPQTTTNKPHRLPASVEHIVVTPSICGGKPRIAGHRIRVQDVAIWHERLGYSVEEIIAHYPQLTLAEVHAALAYYYDHCDAIRRDIDDDRLFVEALKKLHPSKLLQKLRADHGSTDQVPSG
ncbi:MAG TPA: DUF433 domain-containing protein [Candidatus Tectomicrobia bacterium]